MPMILATQRGAQLADAQGAADLYLLNVRSAECIDPHYFAVLIGCGATTVNAYLAQDSIADRMRRGLIDGTLTEALCAATARRSTRAFSRSCRRWGSRSSRPIAAA
jgi:glutamate synthase (NADPH/NADH) large chain